MGYHVAKRGRDRERLTTEDVGVVRRQARSFFSAHDLTHRLIVVPFGGLPRKSLNISLKKELQWSLWIDPKMSQYSFVHKSVRTALCTATLSP